MTSAPPRLSMPPGADLSRGLGIDLAYGVPAAGEQSLWVPNRLKRRVITPDELKVMKVVYFKGCFFGREGEWYGGRIDMPYNLDVDTPGEDGISTRDQIHLYLTGLLERVRNGRWIYQGSDERQGTTITEEWPKFQDTPERWARFFKRMK